MVYFSILSKYVIINRSDYRSSDRRDTSLFKPFTMLEFTPMGLYVIRSFLAQNLPPPFCKLPLSCCVAPPKHILSINCYIPTLYTLYERHFLHVRGNRLGEGDFLFRLYPGSYLERTRKTTPAMRLAKGRCHNVLLTSCGSYRSKVSLALLTADKDLAKRSMSTHNSCVRSTEY